MDITIETQMKKLEQIKGKILFVDDEKLPEWFDLPKDTLHAKNMFTAMNYYIDNRDIKIIYLDHDLGARMSQQTEDGSQWLGYVCRNYRKPEKVFCISFNPIGVERIKNVCKDYSIPFEDIGPKMIFETFHNLKELK